MKINDPSAVINQQNGAAKKTQKKAEADFTKMLSQNIQELESSKAQGVELTGQTTMPLLYPAANIGPVNLNPTLNQDTALIKAESALDLVQRYREGLLDPSTTLNDLNSIIKSMEREAEELNTMMDGLEDEGELKSILSQLSVTMTVEVMKFNRGDYL